MCALTVATFSLSRDTLLSVTRVGSRSVLGRAGNTIGISGISRTGREFRGFVFANSSARAVFTYCGAYPLLRIAHSVGVKASRSLPMRSHRPAMERSPALRSP